MSGAAEWTPGEEGAGFFRKAQPSAELWQMWDDPGSVGHGWREATADAAGAEKGAGGEQLLAHAQDTANWCKVLYLSLEQSQPF